MAAVAKSGRSFKKQTGDALGEASAPDLVCSERPPSGEKRQRPQSPSTAVASEILL